MRSTLLRLIVLAAIAAVAPQVAQAAQPGFDCRLARTPDELAICADDRLSALDAIGAAGFDIARRRPGTGVLIGAVQRLLLARIACQADKLCIFDRQMETLRLYQQWRIPVAIPAWADAYRAQLASGAPAAGGELPQRVGDCVVTAIAGIADRFGKPLAPLNGDFDPGTAVRFENGGSQVSYDREATIERSQVGDRVRMCLVKVPVNCPPGDDRGKVYTTTNLRTGEAWSLPDSQHECGGA